MNQAITTRYLGPTNHRGTRVVAEAQAGRLVVSWDHALSPEANHEFAARQFAMRLGWLPRAERLEGGWLKDGSACWVVS